MIALKQAVSNEKDALHVSHEANITVTMSSSNFQCLGWLPASINGIATQVVVIRRSSYGCVTGTMDAKYHPKRVQHDKTLTVDHWVHQS